MNWNGTYQYQFAQTLGHGIELPGLGRRWPAEFLEHQRHSPGHLDATGRCSTGFSRIRSRTGLTRSSAASITSATTDTPLSIRAPSKFEKRFSQGLTMTSFYTWSKAINDADNDGGASWSDLLQSCARESARGLRSRPSFRHLCHLRTADRQRAQVDEQRRLQGLPAGRLESVLDPDVPERHCR